MGGLRCDCAGFVEELDDGDEEGVEEVADDEPCVGVGWAVRTRMLVT